MKERERARKNIKEYERIWTKRVWKNMKEDERRPKNMVEYGRICQEWK